LEEAEERTSCEKPKPCLKQRTITNLKENYLKVVEMAVISVSIAITEGGLRTLVDSGVEYHTDGTVDTNDVQRVALWCTLLTTGSLLRFLLSRPSHEEAKGGGGSKKQRQICDVCGRNRGDGYVNNNFMLRRKMQRKMKIRMCDTIDFIHSFTCALIYLICVICIISTVPKTHNALQTYLKLIGTLFDLVLALLYTKDCKTTYEVRLCRVECQCVLEQAWEDKVTRKNMITGGYDPAAAATNVSYQNEEEEEDGEPPTPRSCRKQKVKTTTAVVTNAAESCKLMSRKPDTSAEVVS